MWARRSGADRTLDFLLETLFPHSEFKGFTVFCLQADLRPESELSLAPVLSQDSSTTVILGLQKY